MFKNFNEETYYEAFRKYRGCIPNESNSSFDERKVNFFLNFEYDSVGDEIKSIENKLKSSDIGVYIEKITTDMDSSDSECGLVFFDIFLKDDINLKDFKKVLTFIHDDI